MTDMGKNGPQYSASKRPSHFVKQSPGPGAYKPDAQAIKNKAAQFSMGSQKSTMLKELNSNPGPGAHEYTSQITAGSKYGFGTSGRAKLKPDAGPGPGSYEYQKVVGHSNSGIPPTQWINSLLFMA